MAFIHNYLVYIFLLLCAIASINFRKLTIAGGLTGFVVAALVYVGAGYTGIALLALFFVLASAATGWQSVKKQEKGFSERESSRRTAGQVIANGGVAAILGGLCWYLPQYQNVFQLMIAGSLASATADTLSSELGSIYGRRFYNIVSFEKVPAGDNGVVSLEGTSIGIAGAAIIAIAYAVGFGRDKSVWIIIIAGAVGNFYDSILGATLEHGQVIGNNTVNFLNTAMAAMVCYPVAYLLHVI